jgi:hypothetical protein
MPYITGQTQIIGCHHADNMIAYVVGGNTGRILGHGGSYASDDDAIIEQLNRQRLDRQKAQHKSRRE